MSNSTPYFYVSTKFCQILPILSPLNAPPVQPTTMDLSRLSLDETARFVEWELEMPTLAELFREQDVDGSVLVQLTTNTIRQFLPKVSLGQCVKLFTRLEKFMTQSPSEESVFPVSPIVTPISTETVSTLSDGTSTPCPETPVSPRPPLSASDLSDVRPGTAALPTSTTNTLPVPREFPVDKLQLTSAGTAMLKTGVQTIAGKTSITNAVVSLIQKYSTSDGYASVALKRKAATALVYKHPNLMMGMGMKDAVDAWHRAFTQKLTNWRKRGKVVDPTMEDMKQKFQRSRAIPQNTNIQHRRASNSHVLLEEEVAEQSEMKEVLISEMSKPTKSRNRRMIEELTASTAKLRQQFVVTENPHARSLLKEWPSLKIEDIMIKELPRMVEDVAGYSEFSARFNSIIPTLIDLAREKAAKYPSNHPLSSILAKVPYMEATDPDFNDDLHTVAALVALPYLLPTTTKKVTHVHKYIVDVGCSSTTAEDVREAVVDRNQPFIMVYGDVSQPTKFVVYADKTAIISCSTMTKALYILIAVHYVLNIQYSIHVSTTFDLLQEACLGMKTQKRNTKVRELLQKLVA